MGEVDIERQQPNVFRMRLLGAEVRAVKSGSKTLKDAMNEALRDWVTNVHDTFYIIGTAAGPHPYPQLVRDFQCIIGEETREQMIERRGPNPEPSQPGREELSGHLSLTIRLENDLFAQQLGRQDGAHSDDAETGHEDHVVVPSPGDERGHPGEQQTPFLQLAAAGRPEPLHRQAVDELTPWQGRVGSTGQDEGRDAARGERFSEQARLRLAPSHDGSVRLGEDAHLDAAGRPRRRRFNHRGRRRAARWT
jgi:hypothetical protein